MQLDNDFWILIIYYLVWIWWTCEMSALQQKAFHCFNFYMKQKSICALYQMFEFRFAVSIVHINIYIINRLEIIHVFHLILLMIFENSVIEIWKIGVFRDKTLLDIVFYTPLIKSHRSMIKHNRTHTTRTWIYSLYLSKWW